jgi:hypothetical protein
MNEETKIFNDGSKEKKPQNEPKKTNKSKGIKTAAAVAGGVVVGNLAWGLAREAKGAVDEYIAESPIEEFEEVEATEVDQAEPLPDGGIEAADVSEIVTDDMSFNEAFAAARADVGAGGVFEWNGNTYGTYYKEEWDNLSPEETEEYWASVEATDVDIEQEVLPEDIQPDEMIAETETVDIDGDGYEESIAMDTNDDGVIDVVASDFDGDGEIDTVVADTDFDGEPDVIIQETNTAEVEELYASQTNEAIPDVGTDDNNQEQPYMETADLDGDGYEESILADTNADGVIDAVASDLDGDGKIDTVVADTNFDGKIDEIAQDTDGDGELDTHETINNDELLADNSEPEDDNSIDDFDNDSDMSEWA